MSAWLAYCLGLLTIPALLLLAWAWSKVTDTNLQLDCIRCGRTWGNLDGPDGRSYAWVSQLRFKLHRRKCKKLHPTVI